MKSTILAAALAVLLGAPTVGAADLYEPQPEVYQAPAAPVVQANGWYLRGDVSYDFNDVRGLHYRTPAGGILDVGSASLDDGVNVGLGAGYQFNEYFRADVTGDYMFKADFHGITMSSGCGGNCSTNENSSVSLLSLLANAYVDLGTWHRVTPYVGAGVGATYVNWENFTESGNCAACITNPGGEHNWRFTYAVMAGASVDLTCNLKFDAGYRFRHIDGGDAFSDGSNHGFDDGFNVHEVRGGLRYSFGGCAQPQPVYASYEPAPVYK